MARMEIVITMDEAGRVSVNGPLENKILCFGLLEVAKEAIKDFEAPKVKPATADDLARFTLLKGD
jgi:hypothetical protein